MGRILETFRHASEHPALGEPAIDEAVEEIPFIEVGPRRSFEASAAVLAAIPSPSSRSPLLAVAPSVASTPSALPKPHNVLFRALTAPSRFAADLVAFHAPGQASSACYGQLLEAILAASASRAADGRGALLLTAVRPQIGATTVLLNVAITAARQGRRVIVLDANLRRPAVAARLGLEPAPGLAEVLAGECSLDEALRPTEQSNLIALTAGAPTPILACAESLRSLLGELTDRFDLVFVDGPRWDDRTCGSLASACAAVFLVVPGSEADKPPASELVRSLPEQGVKLAGCILTGA